MKKAILYVFAAVALGVGVMLFPYWTFFIKYNESPVAYADGIPYPKPLSASRHWQEYIAGFEDPKAQAQATDTSLQMLAIGFIAAMVVYIIVRRRVRRPTYIPTYGTWRP